MSEFISGFVSGAFAMFCLCVAVTAVAGACKLSGQLSRDEEEAERIRMLIPQTDAERVL